MPEISVIVPFYNVERYIRDCIRGLLAQSYPENAYEIIMVDNNSTDASAAVVRQYPRITLLTEHKQGAYAARNQGLNIAQGATIAFTDPDCIADKYWLSNIAAAMSLAEVHLVLGNCQMAYDTFWLTLLAAHEHQKVSFVLNSHTKELYYGYTNNMAVRRAVFDKLGLFAERTRGGDSLFVRQVVEEYSCNAVRYEANIHVRHMEMASLWKYYQKQFIYGRSNRMWSEIIVARPLNIHERLQIFRRTISTGQYPLTRASLLLALLSIGVICYSMGQWTAAWNLWRRKATEVIGGDTHRQSGTD